MSPNEIWDLKNIVRRAKHIRDIAISKKDNSLTDNAEQLLVYAEALLPLGNRFRRDTNV